ncbi:DUF928 domain-containing protein [Leptothoe spongobia]|uniref:DUF928 domain-containing protein n=1 Tax=Leptothoe spongobia TAU-MAC 1115 TaxID=1967444 RepID=A0A947DLC2_9CYAN|nr:DUF928 domain-containing protein [Leptothoe spongobia]MBT9317894.1 DUF928 domain-containing protein [Leptothoe spongobia TAU-MAC 1115]
MKRKWFTSIWGAVILVIGTAWTQFGMAHAISFTPSPNNSAPRQATGGASRGSFFVPSSDRSAPRQATGGASRSGLFVPPSDSSAPRQATGGGTRGGFFTPPPDTSAPHSAAGGASRGSFFTPPKDYVAPQQTAGAASRTNTYGSYTDENGGAAQMMALMPESFYGTTLSAHPRILVYLPASSAQEAIFTLKNEDRNLVYQMSVPVSGEGGVIAVQLPGDSPELVVGQNYQWYFALKLNGVINTTSPFVDGWIQRIDPNDELAHTLEQGSTLENIAALGSQGIWYDTVAKLATLHTTQPDETIVGHWKELLESVGLMEISTAPITVN